MLNAATGDVIVSRAPDTTPPMTATAAAFGVLHFARFGGQALKALFFVLALAASAVILTGNVLWIEVRRPRDPRATPWVHRLLARLTSGVGIGLLAAVSAAFVISRITSDRSTRSHDARERSVLPDVGAVRARRAGVAVGAHDRPPPARR